MSDQHGSLPLLLRSLHLPAMLRDYERLETTAIASGWSHRQYLTALIETECQERVGRRIQRLLRLSELPENKTLATLDQSQLPAKVRLQLGRLLDGTFVEQGHNVLLFGLPGRGKTHLAAAIGRELLLTRGVAVLFRSAFHLVQQLLAAKAALRIETELAKLDKFDVVIIDDIGYVQQSREEMEILFTFLGERYERKSLIITSNLMFSEWDRIFKDPMTTLAAIDRLVHRAEILELTGESQRFKQPPPATT